MLRATQDFLDATGDYRRWKKGFNYAFDDLCSKIWFASEEQSILPENVVIAKDAFNQFFDDMGWKLPKWCFEELLAEKSGEHEFRADNRTPNWYHEFRECLYYLSFVREGLIREQDTALYGGTEVAIATTLRHDSWEDLGNDRMRIYAPLEKKLHEGMNTAVISEEQGFRMRQKAVQIVDAVDLLTRKTPRLNDDGVFERKPNGKLLKIDRYDGQVNLYYNQIIKSPITTAAKYFDGIEGMSTRIGVLDYSLEDDLKYTAERRMLYGRRKLDLQAIEKFPFLKPAIKSADSMLGILLVGMETVNDFAVADGQDPKTAQNPKYATAIRLEDYLPAATKGFNRLPPSFHPISIFMERMAAKVQREVGTPIEGRTDLLIRNALLPSLAKDFGKINAYRTLSVPTDSAPTRTWQPL